MELSERNVAIEKDDALKEVANRKEGRPLDKRW